MRDLYLCDLDGTVCDLTHRLPLIQGVNRDWRAFFAACSNDKPIPEVITTLQLLKRGGATIVMVSGRSDEVRGQTVTWLLDHEVWYDALYMRKEGDHRPDNIVKSELLDKILFDWAGFTIVGVFDDRKQVVDMFRQRGLKVFQVAEGNF